jgi:hypothetical protein
LFEKPYFPVPPLTFNNNEFGGDLVEFNGKLTFRADANPWDKLSNIILNTDKKNSSLKNLQEQREK